MLDATLIDTVFTLGERCSDPADEERPSKGLSFSGRNETGWKAALKIHRPRLKPRGPVEEFLGGRFRPGDQPRTPGHHDGRVSREGEYYFSNLSTKMTTTTARTRRTINPPYIRKFMNFFPKLSFSFTFSGTSVF